MAGTKPALSDAEIKETLQTLQQQGLAKQAEQQKAMQAEAAKVGGADKQEGDAFLAANAKKPGVVSLPSGLQYKVIKDGTGHSPKTGASPPCTTRASSSTAPSSAPPTRTASRAAPLKSGDPRLAAGAAAHEDRRGVGALRPLQPRLRPSRAGRRSRPTRR